MLAKKRIELADPEKFFNKGCDFLEAEEFEQALPYFEIISAQYPKDYIPYFCIGFCHYKLGHYQSAVKAYKQAINLKPDYAEAHYDLGIAYLLLGNKRSAREEYKILKDLGKEKANDLFSLIALNKTQVDSGRPS